MIPTVSEIADELRAVYGFSLPADFARILAAAYEDSWHSDGHYYSENLEAVLRPFFLLEGEISAALLDDFVLTNEFYGQKLNRRFGFLNLPPEFFPFGDDDENGRIYGFVVHDPDGTSVDLPIGEAMALADDLDFNRYRPLSPLQRRLFLKGPISIVGETTATGLARIFERRVGVNGIDAATTIDEATATSLASTVDRFVERMIGVGKVESPRDWRFEAMLDGIGVYAPDTMFWARPDLWTAPDIDSFAEELEFIESFVKMGFPATALRLIRDLHWRRSEDLGCLFGMTPLWQRIYHEMGRPSLARALSDALNFRREFSILPVSSV